MPRPMKLKTKFVLLAAISVISLMALISTAAIRQKNDLLDGRKLQLRSVVETAYSLLAGFQAQEAGGHLTREAAQSAAISAIEKLRYGGADGRAEYVYIHALNGVTVFHVKSEMIGRDNRERIRDHEGRYTLKDMLAAVSDEPNAYVDTAFPRPGQEEPVNKLQFVMKFAPWGWMVGSGVYLDELEAEYRAAQALSLLIGGGFLLLVIGLGFFIARDMLRQVGGEPDEAIAWMSRAADGDLSLDCPPAPDGSMLASLRTMVASIRKMVAEIGQSSDTLTHDAESINSASQEVAHAARKQAEAAQSMTSAIEEMTNSIQRIAGSARSSQENSLSSVGFSETGHDKVRIATQQIQQIAMSVDTASTRIQKLEEHAGKISSIADVISEIADQTNLLALNAAIEAARAGEAGRGFAVVADEVRKLAERTSQATIEISEKISGIQSDTSEAVTIMNASLPLVDAGVHATTEAAEALEKIKNGAQTTLEHIREVADSTAEQSAASRRIAQRIEEIASMAEQTSGAMQSNADTASDMERVTKELRTLVGRFRC